MRVSLFATCIGDQFFADSLADGVRLLRHLDVDVDFPRGQTCCGQPAFNAGHMEEARKFARHTLRVFESSDYIVLPSGSCAGMLRHHFGPLLGGKENGAESVLGAKTFELSEFIVRVLGVTKLGDGLEGRRVCYHHGCHALRTLGVRDEPLELLRQAGAEVLDWEAAEECCGFGGVFSVKVPHVSTAMADRKLDTLPHPDCVTSADGGCLMQLGGRARKRGLAVQFRHLASVLWAATGSATGGNPRV
ncbi:MAG: (Fe-S)-binding protein [Gemmatimonadetes bacterium]|nr:(Fe-S)-binding protein [Gemmatimonadota bacterium]NNM05590.1 (Fe-S)-binding protein [Gemmatimonadota bacterium]